MNHSTVAVPPGPAFGAVLFGLVHLFAHQPQIAAIAYTIFAITEVVPHVHSIYSSTTPKLNGTTNSPVAADHGAAPNALSSEDIVELVQKTLDLGSDGSTVIVEDTSTLSTPEAFDLLLHITDAAIHLAEDTSAATSLVTSAISEDVRGGEDAATLDSMLSDIDFQTDAFASPPQGDENQFEHPELSDTSIHDKELEWSTYLGDPTDIASHSRSLRTPPNLLDAPGGLPVAPIHGLFHRLSSIINHQSWFDLFVCLFYAIPVAWFTYDHILWHELRYRCQQAWAWHTLRELNNQLFFWMISDSIGDKYPQFEPDLALISGWVTVRLLMWVQVAMTSWYFRKHPIARIKQGVRIFKIFFPRTLYWLLTYAIIVTGICQRNWWLEPVKAMPMQVIGSLPDHESFTSLGHAVSVTCLGLLHQSKTFVRDWLYLSQSNTLINVFLIAILIVLRGVYKRFINNDQTRQKWFEWILGVIYALVVAWIAHNGTLKQHLQSLRCWIHPLILAGRSSARSLFGGGNLVPALYVIWITLRIGALLVPPHFILVSVNRSPPIVKAALRTSRTVLTRTSGWLLLYISIAIVVCSRAYLQHFWYCLMRQWDEFHFLESWKYGIALAKYHFDWISRFDWIRTLYIKLYSSIWHYLGRLKTCLGQVLFSWHKSSSEFLWHNSSVALQWFSDISSVVLQWLSDNKIPLGLFVIALIIVGLLHIGRRQIQRIFLVALEARRGFWRRKWQEIRNQTAGITKDNAERIMEDLTTNRNLPAEVPPPAQEEPASELGVQPETLAAVKDLPTPANLLLKKGQVVRNNNLLQQRINSIVPNKVAPRPTPPTIEKPTDVPSPKIANLPDTNTYVSTTPSVQDADEISEHPPKTAFEISTSLNINDFPLPGLYQHSTPRPATGGNSKEEWRNRLLDGPSILTQMRREAEAAAQAASSDGSNGGDSGEIGDSSGDVPAANGTIAPGAPAASDAPPCGQDSNHFAASDAPPYGQDPSNAAAQPNAAAPGVDEDVDMVDAEDEDTTQGAAGTQQTTSAATNPVPAATANQTPAKDSDEIEMDNASFTIDIFDAGAAQGQIGPLQVVLPQAQAPYQAQARCQAQSPSQGQIAMQSQSPAQGAIASLQDQTAPTVVLGFLPFTFSPLFLEAGVPAQLVSGFNTSQSTGEALPQGNSASVSTPAETAKLLKDLQFQQAQAGSSSQTIDAPQDTAFLSNNDGTCQGFGQTSPSTVDPFTQLQNGTAGEIEAEEYDSNQDFVSALSKDQNDNRDQQTNKHQEDNDAKNDDEDDNLSLESKDNDTSFIGEAEKGAEKQKVLNAEDMRTQENEERRLSKENISPSDRSARSSSLSSADDDPENPYESQAPSRTQDSPPKQADEEEYIKELEKTGDRARQITADEAAALNRKIAQLKKRTPANTPVPTPGSAKFPGGVSDPMPFPAGSVPVRQPQSTDTKMYVDASEPEPEPEQDPYPSHPSMDPPVDGETWWDSQGQAFTVQTSEDDTLWILDEAQDTQSTWHSSIASWRDSVSGDVYKEVEANGHTKTAAAGWRL